MRARGRILLIVGLLGSGPPVARAAGIQTDVALTPPEDALFLRVQYRGATAHEAGEDLNRTAFRTTAVYGLTATLALLGSVAVLHQSSETRGGQGFSESGLSDLALLARYRFWQRDWLGGTFRAAVLAGGTVPTATEGSFGSDSVTGRGGLALSLRDRALATDLSVQAVVRPQHDGEDPGDALRYDLAVAYQVSAAGGAFAVLPVLELNGETTGTDEVSGRTISDSGGTQLFVSPGLQVAFEQLILEASVQLPVYDDFEAARNADDVQWLGGVLLQF